MAKMKKLTMPQMYLLGMIQKGYYSLEINRTTASFILRPTAGTYTNPLHITERQANGLINTGALVKSDEIAHNFGWEIESHSINPEYPPIPTVRKAAREKTPQYYFD